MTKRSRAAAGEEEEEEEEEKVEKNTVANLLLLLSRGVASARKHIERRSVFECKTCYKQFPSFQALGGHCTTHKRPSAAGEPGPRGAARATKKARMRRIHECAVCGMEFGTGQALGGHMRRHKFAATEDLLRRSDRDRGRAGEGRLLLLDLNLPPPEDDLDLKDLFFGVGLFQEEEAIGRCQAVRSQ